MTTVKSFSQLRKSSSNFDKLQKTLKDSTGGKKDYKDARFWFPSPDKSGNAQATIRFLPAVNGEELPFVQTHTHSFQGPGGQWLIENCPTTMGQGHPCPICEANGELWNSGFEKDKEVARKRKRKLNYISNILVVSDPSNPANEGKVFLYKYGKKIFEKLTAAMTPEFDDEKPINPFDFWEGANFKLKIRKVDGFTNYDKSAFDAPTQLLGGDDAKLEALWNTQHKLTEFTDPTQFKSYDDLKKRLDKVLGTSGKATTAADDDTPFDSTPTTTNSRKVASQADDEDVIDENISLDVDDDDSIEAFKKLVE